MKQLHIKKIKILISIAFVAVLCLPFGVSAKVNLYKIKSWFDFQLDFVVNGSRGNQTRIGSVLGPIAAEMLVQDQSENYSLGKLVKQLNNANRTIRIDDEQEKLLRDVRIMYHDQALELMDQSRMLNDIRDNLTKDASNSGLNYVDFEKEVLAIGDIIKVYENASQKLDLASSQVSINDIVKMSGQNIIKEAMGQTRSAVIFLASDEIEEYIKSAIADMAIARETPREDVIISHLVADNIKNVLNEKNLINLVDKGLLTDLVMKNVKENAKSSKSIFRDDFKQTVDNIIIKTINEIGHKDNDDIEGIDKNEGISSTSESNLSADKNALDDPLKKLEDIETGAEQ